MSRVLQKNNSRPNWWRKHGVPGAFGAVLGLVASQAGAYYEDLKEGDTGPHSTFHYEMTRSLARAAGFSKADAEMIAVAAEATDRMLYTGTLPDSPTIQLAGTERMDSVKGPYFHWPRRGVYNATHQYEQPGARNTCLYFTKTDKCVNGKPEIDAIENWAVFNVGAPTVGTPSAAVNGGASAPVAGGSIIALGIYLHALADTYTHDPCMKKLQVRSHMSRSSLTLECSVVRWHQDQEFGPEASNLGTSYTKEGGSAVWKALIFFRQSNGLPNAALWNETQALRFIKTYSEMENEIDRSNYATSVFTSLN